MRDWEEGDDPVKNWTDWGAVLGSEVVLESSEESRYFHKEEVCMCYKQLIAQEREAIISSRI